MPERSSRSSYQGNMWESASDGSSPIPRILDLPLLAVMILFSMLLGAFKDLTRGFAKIRGIFFRKPCNRDYLFFFGGSPYFRKLPLQNSVSWRF